MDEQPDWLDAKLREEAPYLDDAGFTARVVAQLPARRVRSNRARHAILLAITVVACAVAYFLTGGGHFLAETAAFLVAVPLVTICALAVLCGAIASVIGASAAMSRTR